MHWSAHPRRAPDQLYRFDPRRPHHRRRPPPNISKPVLLELGGKAPLVVLDDADLDAAVAAAAFGAFMNQGQICMSTERLVVDQKIADTFVAKLAAKAGSLVAGDPRKAIHRSVH